AKTSTSPKRPVHSHRLPPRPPSHDSSRQSQLGQMKACRFLLHPERHSVIAQFGQQRERIVRLSLGKSQRRTLPRRLPWTSSSPSLWVIVVLHRLFLF